MKLSIYACIFPELELGPMLDYVKSLGINGVELPAGAFMGKRYCDPAGLLRDRKRLGEFCRAFSDRGMEITCLSVHGNPLHPDPAVRIAHRDDIRDCVDLAAELGVSHILTFSGVPGDGRGSKVPHWIVSPCPEELWDVLRWQWEEELVPYWQKMASYAHERGVKIALEVHTGMMVHSPYTVLKLREQAGASIGANIDPSHLWWQGIDPKRAIEILGSKGAVFHFHAKDASFDQDNVNLYGLTDAQPFTNIATRSWNFRGVGRGHSLAQWEAMLDALEAQGYDGPVSIEYEDGSAPFEAGLRETAGALKRLLETLSEKGAENERI